MDYNLWARQQQDSVARTWAALRREEDEIEREEAIVVTLGQRLAQLRDRIQVSPRTQLDALLHQIAKDETRMLASIDAVGARLAHEKAVFQREVQRIMHSKANTSRSDRHTRAAWDYAEQIWRHEESQIQERIDRVAAMGLDCRRRLAASARRRPSTAAVDAEPPAEELRTPPRERKPSHAPPPTTADRFMRERRPSNVVPSSAPAPVAPVASREFIRERRPSAAVPTSRPVTSAARPATAAAAPPTTPARTRPPTKRSPDHRAEPRERDRERERDRDRDREHRRERTRSSVQTEDRMRTAAAWTAYECRWAGLQAPIPSAPTTPLTFHNVPWPVGFQPDSPRSLTPDRIKKFLLSPNHSPHRSPKERLKSALSLWRPEEWDDKWMNNVEPSEREKVRYGVTVVAQCLGELLKEARRNPEA
ncbi:hypothetical protein RhiJN_12540 [Ceratobasidium sp. AG-Ba]|nr:hypothetical protein RhiJN_12540 [Ceratobasidium sp. AG-Ba]